MAFREVAMWEILAVLERLARRESRSAITRATGHSRSTIRRYERHARALGWAPESGVLASDQLAADIAARCKPAPKTEGDAEAVLRPHREQITAWLAPKPDAKRGLRLTKVHQLLERQGVEVPYSSLHRFAVAHCHFGRRSQLTVRMAPTAPGEVAEIDFGKLGRVHDPATGRMRVVWALIVVLPYSRHQSVQVMHTQTVDAVIGGLEAAWLEFGGVAARAVLDNLKAAITKADRYDPIIQRTFEEYARHRGFLVDAAPVRMPTGKPHVERAVQYVRENFFRGETWRDLAHVQEAVSRWVREVAGLRVHGTTRQQPLVVFESSERAAMRPVTTPRFDPPRWAQCTVHPDHHVSFGKALYSVPSKYVRHRVWVRGDSSMVRIYAAQQLIKTHPTQPPGGRSTEYADYPTERSEYARRDPERLIAMATERGACIGQFATALLSGPIPWARIRQAQSLLRLCDKYGTQRVNDACARAIDYELFNVPRVERMLRQNLTSCDAHDRVVRDGTDANRSSPRFARAPESFVHPSLFPVHPAPESIA